MKKPCPDLVTLNDEALRAFWQEHRPENLKALGDRLLAESLPRFPARDEGFYPPDLSERRESIPCDAGKMSELLGVNPNLLRDWESQEVRPPASLSLIYARLATQK